MSPLFFVPKIMILQLPGNVFRRMRGFLTSFVEACRQKQRALTRCSLYKNAGEESARLQTPPRHVYDFKFRSLLHIDIHGLDTLLLRIEIGRDIDDRINRNADIEGDCFTRIHQGHHQNSQITDDA